MWPRTRKAMEEDELTLSDVHVGRTSVATEKSGVVITRFIVRHQETSKGSEGEDTSSHETDEDGDLVLTRDRSQSNCDIIYIHHAMSTTLKDVGLQVWAGSLLLCDFVMGHPEIFRDKIILELGAGTGLPSIVAAKEAKHVICTDIGEEVLDLCQLNMTTNDAAFQSGKVSVKEYDWNAQPVAGNGKFDWSGKDLSDLYKVDIILAADVIYSNDRTFAFFETIKSVCKQSGKCEIYIAIEQRLNFTLSDLDVSCPAYNYFLKELQSLIQQEKESEVTYKVRQEPTEYPQYFDYQRTKYLELWYISTERKGSPEKDPG